jgi:DNA (cytosine-5)-methyltransferase 1
VTAYRVVSLFTGAGGIDLGFEAAGAKIMFSADNMPEACETIRFNFPKSFVYGPPLHDGEIAEVNQDTIYRSTGLGKGDIDILIAGPPCQPFSVAAAQRFLKSDSKFKRKGYECEDRGQLIFQALRIIQELLPRVFLIENVEGIATIDNGKSIKFIRDYLAKEGYNVTRPFTLDAMHYGVPQHRQRVFIVGNRGMSQFTVPDPEKYHQVWLCPSVPYHTVSQALLGFDYSLPNSDIRNHKEGSIERYKKLEYGQREPLGRVDRLDPLKPAKTVIAGGSRGGGRSHLHPFVARTLSVRECARLQTFPDTFVFFGKIGRQFTQVGNAVPPLLAEILAREILSQFFEFEASPRLSFKPDYIDAIEAASRLRDWSTRVHPNLLYHDISVSHKILQRPLAL